MGLDLWLLYRRILRSRRFEEAVTNLWEQGKILPYCWELEGQILPGTGRIVDAALKLMER